MVRGQKQKVGAPPKRDLYTMEVDRERNCYVCRGFEYIACYYRNQGRERVAEERRLEYEGSVKIKDCELSFSLFYFLILFSFDVFFNFLILRTLGLGVEVIGHTVTSVTSDGVVTVLIIELERRK